MALVDPRYGSASGSGPIRVQKFNERLDGRPSERPEEGSSRFNLNPGAIWKLFDQAMAVGPPRASVVGSKLHADFPTFSPHHRAMVHAGVANDPEPKNAGKYPSRGSATGHQREISDVRCIQPATH